MTFKIKIRGAAGPIVAEYVCPEHGRFELTVGRDDNGDAPNVTTCPVTIGTVSHSGITGAVATAICGQYSPFAISAPLLKFPYAISAVRGKSDERPSPYHHDFTKLADGNQTIGEWQEERDALWSRHRDEQVKKAVS